MKYPKRYFTGLSEYGKKLRRKELDTRRKYKTFKLGKSDTLVKPKKSKWTRNFHREYPGVKFNTLVLSNVTRIPKNILNTVFNRGRRAWQTGGSRPGVTADQWGIARVYKFILVTRKGYKTTRYDPNSNLRRKVLTK